MSFLYSSGALLTLIVCCLLSDPIVKLPYRMVFAVATIDSVLLYDTQSMYPFALLKNIHYASLTDLSWNCDGTMLAISSNDAYVSLVSFSAGELGKVYPRNLWPDVMRRKHSPTYPADGRGSLKVYSSVSRTINCKLTVFRFEF